MTTTTTTTTRYTALRAMLAARGNDTDRINAGIDAMRSPRWRETVAATLAARRLRQQTLDESDAALAQWMPMPRAERVPGATKLRGWLRERLGEIRSVRRQRGNVEYRVAVTQAKPCGNWGGYINVRLWECDGNGNAYRQIDSRERIFGGAMVRSQGAKALEAIEEKAAKLERQAFARSAAPAIVLRAIDRFQDRVGGRWVRYDGTRG